MPKRAGPDKIRSLRRSPLDRDCTFVGGPWDGETRVLREPPTVIRVPTASVDFGGEGPNTTLRVTETVYRLRALSEGRLVYSLVIPTAT